MYVCFSNYVTQNSEVKDTCQKKIQDKIVFVNLHIRWNEYLIFSCLILRRPVIQKKPLISKTYFFSFNKILTKHQLWVRLYFGPGVKAGEKTHKVPTFTQQGMRERQQHGSTKEPIKRTYQSGESACHVQTQQCLPWGLPQMSGRAGSWARRYLSSWDLNSKNNVRILFHWPTRKLVK